MKQEATWRSPLLRFHLIKGTQNEVNGKEVSYCLRLWEKEEEREGVARVSCYRGAVFPNCISIRRNEGHSQYALPVAFGDLKIICGQMRNRILFTWFFFFPHINFQYKKHVWASTNTFHFQETNADLLAFLFKIMGFYLSEQMVPSNHYS